MIRFIKRLTGHPAPKSKPETEGRLAAAALLVAIAHSDHEYADTERRRILAALRELFELSDDEAEALCAQAEQAHETAADLHRFTLAVKTAYTIEERGVFLEAAWRVVLADGQRDDHENALMRRLAALLGVEDRVSAHARRRAEARKE
ncbi:MAG: TerB family tellurite resistance protein [Neomegalonema sp.]|nr:TerB family tellurite resistance protein [Neomegalonema sp.]